MQKHSSTPSFSLLNAVMSSMQPHVQDLTIFSYQDIAGAKASLLKYFLNLLRFLRPNWSNTMLDGHLYGQIVGLRNYMAGDHGEKNLFIAHFLNTTSDTSFPAAFFQFLFHRSDAVVTSFSRTLYQFTANFETKQMHFLASKAARTSREVRRKTIQEKENSEWSLFICEDKIF